MNSISLQVKEFTNGKIMKVTMVIGKMDFFMDKE